MLYLDAVLRKNMQCPPIWFMRQAGRYHSHYQGMKRRFSFMELCKIPEAAAEVTFGPIMDFDFDSAILFSDLLFPLEVIGMGLRYDPGPKLDWHFSQISDAARLNPEQKSAQELVQGIAYQGQALRLIRKHLAPQKALLGFVGGPLTLFYYAAEGSHQGASAQPGNAKSGLRDGRFETFNKIIVPLLIENMCLQASSGADAIAIMDTCAGEIEPWLYKNEVIPSLHEVMTKFRSRHPNTPVVYYSKGTHAGHWQHLKHLPFECLGIDWNPSLAETLEEWGDRWSIQGNFDPHRLLLPKDAFRKELEHFFKPLIKLPREKLKGWVCGLGHGVLQQTPESNVKEFIQYHREVFQS